MSEDDFRQFLSHLRFEDGKIFLGNARSVIVTAEWLTDLMMELENLMGVPGTYALLDAASRRNQPPIETLAPFKDLPFEHKIAAFLRSIALVGFGFHEIKEISKDPFKVVLESLEPIIGDAYQGKADGPRCYYNNSWLPRIEGLLKLEGIEMTLKQTESQCRAQGAPHCVIVIEEDKGFM